LFLWFGFALVERKTEPPKKIEYRSAEGKLPLKHRLRESCDLEMTTMSLPAAPADGKTRSLEMRYAESPERCWPARYGS